MFAVMSGVADAWGIPWWVPSPPVAMVAARVREAMVVRVVCRGIAVCEGVDEGGWDIRAYLSGRMVVAIAPVLVGSQWYGPIVRRDGDVVSTVRCRVSQHCVNGW